MVTPADSAIFAVNRESAAQQFRKALLQLGYPQLDKITCDCQGDRIVLIGEIDSFYLKQVAQTVAVKIGGVRAVENKIVVTNLDSV